MYYIGMVVSSRELQVFADTRKAEVVLAESGYDFVSGPYDGLQNAKDTVKDFGDYDAFRGWRIA